MRILSVLVIMIFATALHAQTIIPGNFSDPAYGQTFAHHLPLNDNHLQRKWSFSKYAGFSAGYSFFKGGSASIVAAPVVLQLNRRLTNNLYAFANIAAAPAYVNFNGAFLPGDLTKSNVSNSFSKGNSFGIYSKAALGLMYINDAKTFSISGSIGVERSSYPVPYYNPKNTTTATPVTSAKR